MIRALAFFRALSWPIALHAAALIVLVVGLFAVGSFFAYSPWYAKIAGALFLGATWFTLYHLEFYYRTRRTLGREL